MFPNMFTYMHRPPKGRQYDVRGHIKFDLCYVRLECNVRYAWGIANAPSCRGPCAIFIGFTMVFSMSHSVALHSTSPRIQMQSQEIRNQFRSSSFFIGFTIIFKSTDLRLGATATFFSPMRIFPQRKAHFAWGTAPRRPGRFTSPLVRENPIEQVLFGE